MGGATFKPDAVKAITCDAEMYLADDYGDNHATIKCGLAPGHSGAHNETFERRGKSVVITWEVDERETKEEIAAREKAIEEAMATTSKD